MILNIIFPFMIVKTDYLKEQTRETEARLEATIKSLSEKIKATEKLYEKMQREKDSIRRDIEHWRVQFSAITLSNLALSVEKTLSSNHSVMRVIISNMAASFTPSVQISTESVLIGNLETSMKAYSI